MRRNIERILLPGSGIRNGERVQMISVTASVGIATYRGVDDNVHTMMERADMALYQAKAAADATAYWRPPNRLLRQRSGGSRHPINRGSDGTGLQCQSGALEIARSAQPLTFINTAEYDPLLAAIGDARLVLLGEAHIKLTLMAPSP